MILFWALAACGSPETCDPDRVSWERTARPVLTTWCTPCHAAAVPAEERQGAPLGLDFDTHAGAAAAAAGIAARLDTDAPTMPPGGAMPEPDRLALLDWIACDAPGGTTPAADPCAAAPTLSGDPTATANLCSAGPVHVAGSLTLATELDASCLCTIEGDLAVHATAHLPRLTSVGGALSVAGLTSTLEAPELTRVATLHVDAPALTTLDLSRLAVIDHDATVGVTATERLALTRVHALGGTLLVQHSPTLELVQLDRLETVGGSVIFRDLPALRLVSGTHGVHTVGGALTFERLPALLRVDEWSVLSTLAGPLTVLDTGVTRIRGFDRLVTVPGVHIQGNPALTLLTGLADLEHVSGSVVLADNDALVEPDTWHFLDRIDGDLVIRDHTSLQALPGLTALTRVGGSVQVTDNPSLSTAIVQDVLHGVEIGGTLTIEGNAAP